MRYDKYPFENFESALTYEFISHGRNGHVRKRIVYKELEPKVYGLKLGDVEENDNLNLMTVTNNGDIERIFNTIAASAVLFLDDFPDCEILFVGSTPSRTRLYRMAISKNLQVINEKYDMLGVIKDQRYPFEKDINYEMFIVKRKALTL